MHVSFSRLCLTIVLAGSVPLFAQTPTQPPPSQPPGKPTTAQGADMTLTGCLKSSAAAPTPGSTAVFTLEVSEQPMAKPPGSPEAGAPSRPAVATKTTYTLSAPDSVGLVKHVNHQVQLTGKLAGGSSTPSTAAPGTAPKPATGGGHRTFEVSALKMVSATCS